MKDQKNIIKREKQADEVWLVSKRVFGEGVSDDMLSSAEFEVLKTGQYYDERYGQFEVTEQMIKNLANNFNTDVLGVGVAVDKNHEWGDGAVAWVNSLRASGGKLYATFKDYSEEGKKLLKEKIFKYFSVEFAPFEKVDEEGNKITIMEVLRGIALTNRPVIKGMKPAFMSEPLFHNFSRMEKFKLFAQELKAKGKVSKEEVSVLKGMFAMLSEEEQTEAKPQVDEVEETVEEPAKPAEEVEEPKKELAEKISLAEFNKMKTDMKELSEKNSELNAKLELKQLGEDFQGSMVLSESVKTGFQKDDQEAVVGFMAKLSEPQRTEFKAIVGKVRSVDLAKIGSANAVKVEAKFSEDAVIELSEKLLAEGKAKDITEAQKMATAQLSEK